MEIKNTKVYGFKAAIRGMRNPKKSHHLSDSFSRIDNDIIFRIYKNVFFDEAMKESNKEQFFFGENDIVFLGFIDKGLFFGAISGELNFLLGFPFSGGWNCSFFSIFLFFFRIISAGIQT